MAFPVVEATNTSSEPTNKTSHTVALPAGIVSGELLLVWMAVNLNESPTFPAGWTRWFITGYATLRLALAYRLADGGEGASIFVTTATSLKSAHISYRISGAEDPATQAPQESSNVFGSDDSPNPGNLIPAGGAKDYLWLAMDTNKGVATSAAPASYGSLLSVNVGSAAGLGSSHRSLNAASENPGVMTLASAIDWVAETVAVHPAPSGSASKRLLVAAGR